ncbi:hypothetical protein DSO57_1015586 [Entomophthora muscae]|uniref:Uncharacterized protein n=1 Tax=Entomophthora muscae TaxID=34485 RepID=A0ACC2TSA2_9FUNG|nr:hypothetical protein DSO57_1015586 [Entomophthora muscae]
MQFNLVSTVLLALSASALEYARPTESYGAEAPAAPAPAPAKPAAPAPAPAKAAASKKAAPKKSAPKKTASAPSAPRMFGNGVIQDFGTSSDAFSISDIILTPSVPVAGQPLDVHLIGKLKKTIDKGSKVVIKADYDGSSILDIELDACELASERKFKHQCPAQPEAFDVHHTLRIPGDAPKGNYAIKAYGFNQDNVRIFNVSIIHNSPKSSY